MTRKSLYHALSVDHDEEDKNRGFIHYVTPPPPAAIASSILERNQGKEILPGFESLDYEDVENTVYRSDVAALTPWGSVKYSTIKWFICLMIGAITAGAAFAVNFGVENIAGFKFWATLTTMEHAGYFPSFLLYSCINGVLVLGSVLVTVFIGPAAAGSGISEVKAYLNGVDVPGIFHFNTLVAKLVGAMGTVSGGLAIGKEGPFVHAGAGIAAIVSQGGPSHLRIPWFQSMWNDSDRIDMVACGAAAGVAAAFRSPVGGVLFVFEELTSRWKHQLLWLMFFTTAIVSVVVRIFMKACVDNSCGFFGSGGFIIFEIAEGQDNYEAYELLPVLLLGVVGGLLGSSFITLNAKLATWRKTKVVPRWGVRGKICEAVLVSLLTSIVSFGLPFMVPCQPCPLDTSTCPRLDNSHSGNFVSFGCRSKNQYNDLATIFFNTQDDAIRNLFSSQTKREYTVTTLIIFVTCYYFLAVVTYGISCPTGLFVPSILCGAAYGRLVGIFVADLQRHRHIDEGTYALLGAASFLGGSMRLTMSACVMLLELTNNLALLPLIMLVLLVAKVVGDGTGVKNIYEVLMDVKGLPFLPPQPEGFTKHVTVKECCSHPAVTLSRVEQVRHLIHILSSYSHNCFPVIDSSQGTVSAPGLSDIDTPRQQKQQPVLGIVLRQHLMVLLSSRKALQSTPQISAESSRMATAFRVADFSKPVSSDGLTLQDLHLLAGDMDMFVDLGPYVNPSYYVVHEDASLSKAYALFRTLGLRHLCVIRRTKDVVGIITRKDLLPDQVEGHFEQGLGQYTTDGIAMTAASASTPHVNGESSKAASTKPSRRSSITGAS
ncbi:hypothetical protein CEUSTIGMA_g336.t1 [Chlamydomonas eustigma]|uniref:Chloride channel protein n=1 Tax=Chlamydomonas eustigma TaxID=1157962 RepID=A0A250WQ08_9CHLO|nr:hypothetical protein CEUSTIGMA_g336.t1 [Chlamydomonas eustigma]|eukprot:GAX72881.1 hypothetical protein CEUSTIGMA_g336.t1 [Chlamydomonas eustigma]